MKILKKLWYKINFFFWWRLKADEKDKTICQFDNYGMGIMRDGKFINIKNLYK